MGVIGRLVKWVLGLGTAVLIVTMAAVLYFSAANLRAYGDGRALDAPADAILVLGGGIDGDGVLGYSSRRRVAAAVTMLREGKTRLLILAGGAGTYHPGVPAAELMRAHAIALGAAPEALIIEPASVSSFENLRFGFALAAERRLSRLALLTDAYHLERARRLAAYFGHPDIGLVAVAGLDRDRTGDRAWSILREALAWWFNMAKVAGWEALAAAGMDAERRQELIR